MGLRVAFQTSPFDILKAKNKTTLLLALEAQRRGHEVAFFRSPDVFLDNGVVKALTHKVQIAENLEDGFTLGQAEVMDLAVYDVICLRSTPPLTDMDLFCHMVLEKLDSQVLLLNHPHNMRNFPGKIFPLEFPEFVVEQMITADAEKLAEFHMRYGDIIIKPYNGHAGKGVLKFCAEDKPDFQSVLDQYATQGQNTAIAQKFIPEAVNGDKRILLIDGDPVGAINRIPPEDSFISNISQGGRVAPCEMTVREKDLCARLGPRLRTLGLFCVGLDMLGDYIAEINVITPGTMTHINQAYGIHCEKVFWDRAEAKLKE